jgi:hypothetical protein
VKQRNSHHPPVRERAQVARREQAGVHWITITTNVDPTAEEVFDPGRMRTLYDVGYESARADSAGI